MDKTEPTETKQTKVAKRSFRNVIIVIGIATVIIVSGVAIHLIIYFKSLPTMTPNPIVVDIPSNLTVVIIPSELQPLPPFYYGSITHAELHLPVRHNVTFTLGGTALAMFEIVDVELFFYRGTEPIGNFFVTELDLNKNASSRSIQLTAGDYYIRMGYSVWTSTSVPPTTLQIIMTSQLSFLRHELGAKHILGAL